MSVTSGIVTRVDADYNQSSAYVAIQDGGISAGSAALPAPAVTPWVPATPVPTPSPTPEITATPEVTAAPETAAPADATVAPTILSSLNPMVLYVGGGLLLAVVILVVILISRKSRKG